MPWWPVAFAFGIVMQWHCLWHVFYSLSGMTDGMPGAWCHFVQPAKLKEKRAAVASLPPTARKVTEMMEAMVPPMA